MPTHVQVDNISLSPAKPAGQPTPAPGHPTEPIYGPTAFKINLSLQEAAHTAIADEVNVTIVSKVPGGSGEGPGPEPDVTDYRIFELAAKPTVVNAAATDNPDGSKKIQLELLVPSKVPTKAFGYSDHEQQTMRLLAMAHPPTYVSETAGIDALASPDTGNTRLVLSFNYPLSQH